MNYLFGLVTVGLMLLAFSQQLSIAADQKMISAISQSSELGTAQFELVAQERCAAQSKEVLNQAEADANAQNPPTEWSVEDHYNVSMNKCFVMVTSQNAAPSGSGLFAESDIISDAFERKTYAEFFGVLRGPTLQGLTSCEVYLQSGQWAKCSSPDQFDKLVSQYLGPVLQ